MPTARYIFYARGSNAFSDDRQAKRCLPVLAFLRGPNWHTDPTLPAGLVKVLHGGRSDGGLYMPELRGDMDYDRNLAALWSHPSIVGGAGGFWSAGGFDAPVIRDGEGALDFIILEQDVEPRSYDIFRELFDCPVSEVCGFAYELHHEWRGAAPAGPKPCSFGGCEPWSGYIGPDGLPLQYPGRWARQSGLGLLRIKGTLPARHPRPDWPDGGDWRTLDSRFTPWLTATLGARIHVHWDEESPTKMIQHNHGKCIGDL